MPAPLSPDEEARRKALHRHEILDTEPELEFDDATLLAFQICETPIALLTLVDEKRQWLKSKVGLQASESCREIAFCDHTISPTDVLVVPDAQADERFATNPLVTGDPRIRFYAGAPLMTSDGHALGTLCVIDQVPRELSPEKRTALQALSRQVVAQLESRRNAIELRETVAQLKATEESLRTSEEKFQQLAENITDAFWITCPDLSTKLYISPGYEAIWGRSKESLYANPKQWIETILQEDRERVHAAFASLKADERKVSVEYQIVRPDGSIRWVLDRGFQVRSADGILLRIIGIATDITGRKRRDEKVGRLAAIIESSDDAIISKTLSGHITSWNPAAERMFGYTPSEIIGQPLELIVPPDRHQEELDILAGLGRGELVRRLETVSVRKNGQRFDVSTTISPIRNEEGKVVGASKIIREITEQKRAENALKTSELRYRSLFDSMTEGYAFCRVLYGQEGKMSDFIYLEVNKAFESLTGLKNVVGHKVSEIIPGIQETNPEFFESYGRVASTGKPEKYETFVKTLGIWFSISVNSPVEDHFIAVFDNITERKQAEAKIAFDEQRYRSLVEETTSMVWDTPASGKFEVEQPGWMAFTGQSFEELRGWGWLNVIHPDDQAETKRLWSSAVSGRTTYEIEHRVLARDGTYHDMTGRAVPILAKDGTILQWIGVHTDITERKRVDEALRLLKSAVLQSRESILITDAELDLPGPRIIFTNPAFTTMTGFTAEEALGKTPRILQGPLTNKAVLKRLRKNLENGEIFAGEAINYRKDGTTYNQEWQIAPIHDSKGVTTHFVAIQRDVTERTRIEARYRQLVESNVQGVFFFSKIGGISDANDAFLRLLGYTREDLAAGHIGWMALTPPEYAQRDQLALEEVAATGVCRLYEKEFIAKDGTRVPIILAGAAFADNPDEGVCFVVDLTERKSLEARLYQSQKMETVGKLAGGIAHEFNSILTAIIGQSELLLSDLAEGSSQAKSASEISKAAIRAANLTRQLLAYGRKQQLEPQVLDLGGLIGDMEGTLDHLLGQEADLLVVSCDGIKSVLADAGQIEQVIMNIILKEPLNKAPWVGRFGFC